MNRTTFVCLLSAAVLLGAPLFATTPEVELPTDSLVPAVCFAPDTPSHLVEAHAKRFSTAQQIQTSIEATISKFQFADSARWSATATNGGGLGQGDPTTITWSIVPDGTSIFGYAGEPTANSDLQAWLDGIYGSQAVWLPIFEQVFARWGELTGVTYIYEPNDDGAPWTALTIDGGALGVRGDVRISAHTIDGNSGILAYNFFPDFGDMVLDSGDNTYNNTASSSLILRNVLAHEHGHGLGLSHVCPVNNTKLMEPFLSTAFDGPQFDDILATNRGYGDNSENNDSSGLAASLGGIAAGGSVSLINRSIDDNSDTDFYSFVAGAGLEASVTVTPDGSTYLSGPQNANGSCSAGTSFNALDNQDLSVSILDTDGSTVLGSVDANGAGAGETLSSVTLPGAGTFFVNIDGGATNEAQLYNFTVSVDNAGGGGLVLTGPTPGLTGVSNTWSVTGATAGQRIYFIWGRTAGSGAIPGCTDTTGIDPFNRFGSNVADGAGNASISRSVPGSISGQTLLFQAVELGTCTVSNVVTFTFP